MYWTVGSICGIACIFHGFWSFLSWMENFSAYPSYLYICALTRACVTIYIYKKSEGQAESFFFIYNLNFQRREKITCYFFLKGVWIWETIPPHIYSKVFNIQLVFTTLFKMNNILWKVWYVALLWTAFKSNHSFHNGLFTPYMCGWRHKVFIL